MAWLVVVCAIVTVITVFFVFRPLMVGVAYPFSLELDGTHGALKRLLRKKETIYENIKDLEFEYKMGKFSEEDYQRLRDDDAREAYEVMNRIDSLQPETLQKAGKPQVVAVLKSGKKSKK